jgi:hypothetical protein
MTATVAAFSGLSSSSTGFTTTITYDSGLGAWFGCGMNTMTDGRGTFPIPEWVQLNSDCSLTLKEIFGVSSTTYEPGFTCSTTTLPSGYYYRVVTIPSPTTVSCSPVNIYYYPGYTITA